MTMQSTHSILTSMYNLKYFRSLIGTDIKKKNVLDLANILNVFVDISCQIIIISFLERSLILHAKNVPANALPLYHPGQKNVACIGWSGEKILTLPVGDLPASRLFFI